MAIPAHHYSLSLRPHYCRASCQWRSSASPFLLLGLSWALLSVASVCHAADPRQFHSSRRPSVISNKIRNSADLQRQYSRPIVVETQRQQIHAAHPPISTRRVSSWRDDSLSLRGGDATSAAVAAKKKRMANLKERTLSAILMLVGLVLWLDTFREKGLILLVLIVQMGLYREGTNVPLLSAEQSAASGGKKDGNQQSTWAIKWWWFLAYDMALVGPRLLSTKRDGSPLLSPSSIYLTAFGMMIVGILSFVITLNNSIAFSYEFQIALEELASYHLATILLILPSSFWIATIQDYGMTWVLYALYLVMINDTMAYVFGASMGKRPLLPTISPKKTWEGFSGALVSTMVLSVLLWDKMNLGNFMVGGSSRSGTIHALVIAAYCSLVAPFGGFLASIVKRAYGKKDFSSMIAGHGGFIDRLDCQLITAPFIYLYLRRFVLPRKL